MIGPEINHHFLQLPLAVNGAQDARHLQFARQELRRTEIIFFEIFHHRLAILRIVHRVLIAVSRSIALRGSVALGRIGTLHLASHCVARL